MGTYLSTPKREKCSEDSDNYRFSVGASSMQGWRLAQEDAHNAILSFSPGASYFGVYDGHGGHEVAAYTALHLPNFIKESQEFNNGDFEKALEQCFIRFDETLTRQEVIAALRKLMNKDEEEEEEEEYTDEVNHLYQEATMPIEDVIARFKDGEVQISTQGPTNKSLDSLKAECSSKSSNNKPRSPFLTAKRLSTNGNGANKHIHFDENGEAKSEDDGLTEVKTEKECPKNGEKTEDQNGNVDEKEETALTNGTEDKKTVNVVSKGKGKGKGKGKSNQIAGKKSDTLTEQPSNEAPTEVVEEEEKALTETLPKKSKKSAEELYQNMLAEGEDSSSDEDDDDAFPNAKESSDEDEEGDELEDEEDSEPDTEDDEDDDDEDVEEMMGPRNVKEEPGNDSGCTAVVGLIVKDELFVANAGDSRCVVCRNGEAIEMSMDHKPEDEPEKKRIEKAGGKVTADGRVDGGLNLSRALGDHAYKLNTTFPLIEQMISPQPDIRTLKLDPKTDSFIILACDGIWNSLSSQEVVDFIKPRLEKNPEKISSICEELFDACLAPDTSGDGTGCDNMTAVIIKIKDSYNPLHEANSSKRRPSEDFEDDAGASSSKKLKTEEEEPQPGNSALSTTASENKDIKVEEKTPATSSASS